MTKEKEKFDVAIAAKELLALFEAHSTDDKGALLVSEHGLAAMSNFFGDVPKEERGYVFLNFLADLYEAGHKYDMQQFLNMKEVPE